LRKKGTDSRPLRTALRRSPMMRLFGRMSLPLAIAALSGCLTHMSAKEDSGSLGILWRPDFESARSAAAASGQPLLVVLVAGELKDQC